MTDVRELLAAIELADVPQLAAAVRVALNLHREVVDRFGPDGYCHACGDDWPCATVTDIAAALEVP